MTAIRLTSASISDFGKRSRSKENGANGSVANGGKK